MTVDARDHSLAVGTVADGGQVVYYASSPPAVPWPRQIGILPRRADCFQGVRTAGTALRRSEHDQVVAVQCHVLVGLGGVGKTQLAAQHARRVWDEGTVDLVVWVTATSREAITAAYARAAVEILGASPTDPEHAAAAFLSWLEPKRSASGDKHDPHPWLIVLDDVLDPADLSGLWPPDSPHGRTLITTRRRDAALSGSKRHMVQVDLFSPDEAVAYFTEVLATHGRREPAGQLAALAEDLGHLPLALSQAAAYLIDSSLDCAAYRRRLADRTRTLADVLPEPSGLPDDQLATADAAWSLAIDRADRLRPAGLARGMLQLIAMLDPNGVPNSVVTSRAARAHLAADPSDAGGMDRRSRTPISTTQAEEALRALHRLNLIDHTLDGRYASVRTHRLIQRSVRDRLHPRTLHGLARTAADALLSVWPAPAHDRVLTQTLLANVSALRRCAEEDLYRPDFHPVLFRYGNSLGALGQANAALGHFRKLFRAACGVLEPDHPQTLSTRHEIARWLGQKGDVLGARAAFERLLSDRRRILGAEHAQTLATQHSLAYWRGRSGDTAGAISAFEELLAARTSVLGPDHSRTRATRQDLIRWRGMAGEPKAAMTAFEELLADQQRSMTPNHPRVLATRHNLAYWRGMAGDAPGAKAAFEELLTDRLRVLGGANLQTLSTRHELARWRGMAGDPLGAKTAFEELLTDRLRILGPDHPQTLTTRNELARWQGESGDFVGATAALEVLLADQNRVLGSDDLRTMITRHELARWRAMAGDPLGAKTAFEELLTDRLRILGPDHPQTLTTRNELARWQGERPDGTPPP
ncbi:tetratricopeptide repeat protein [Streptomyces sp. NPDC002104]